MCSSDLQGLNLAGNIAMVIPGGQAIGGALKLAALGVDLVRYGVANKDKIFSAAKAAVRIGGQVAKKTGEFFTNPAKVAGELKAAAMQDMKAIGNKAVDTVKDVGSAIKDKFGSLASGLGSLFGH